MILVASHLLQEVMSLEDETLSCYCLMDSLNCHFLLEQPGCFVLTGEPLTEEASKRLRLAAFGCAGPGTMEYSLRIYCVDDTPHAFQVQWLQLGFNFCLISTRNKKEISDPYMTVGTVYSGIHRLWLLTVLYVLICIIKRIIWVISNIDNPKL